jgi:hypothetical protein
MKTTSTDENRILDMTCGDWGTTRTKIELLGLTVTIIENTPTASFDDRPISDLNREELTLAKLIAINYVNWGGHLPRTLCSLVD